MKKTILIQLFILFAFSTFSIAQNKTSISASQIPSTGINLQYALACTTNFAFGQPDNGTMRTIEVTRQGYRDANGDCVFDLNLFVPANYPEPQNIKWNVNGTTVATNEREITIPIPDDTSIVSVTFMIGNQPVTASRTFYLP